MRTEARISDVDLGPDWLVEFQWNGELHTARTSRLTGSPQAGDRIIVMIDPDDPGIAASPGMSMQDWSELPGLLAMHTSFVVAAILVLRLVRPEAQKTPARPILRPRGPSAQPRRSGGTRPARRRTRR